MGLNSVPDSVVWRDGSLWRWPWPWVPTDLLWQKRLVKMSHLCLQTAAVPQLRLQLVRCHPFWHGTWICSQCCKPCKQVQPMERRLEQREVERESCLRFQIGTQEQMEGGDRVKKLLLSSSLSSSLSSVCWLYCNEVNIYSMLLSRWACSLSNN